MTKTVQYLSLCLLLLLTGCGQKAPSRPVAHPLSPGQIINHTGTPIAWEAFINNAAKADYILLGENHDNAFHHMMQARILDALATRGIQPVLALEMLSKDLQPALDTFNRGKTTLAELPQKLDWQKNWGVDYALYASIFETAQRHHIAVYALNIPQQLLSRARYSGIHSITAAQRHFMPTTIIPTPERQRQMLENIYAMHQTMRNSAPPKNAADKGFSAFLLSQSLWDSTMAETAYHIHQKERRPVVILAGSGHVEYGYGVYSRLKRFAPQANILLVLPAARPDLIEHAGSTVPAAGMDGLMTLPVPAHYYFYAPQRSSLRLGIELEFQEHRVTIVTVQPESPAARAGLSAGDEIILLNGMPVKNGKDLHLAAQKSSDPQAEYLFVLRRGIDTITAAVKKPTAPQRPAKGKAPQG